MDTPAACPNKTPEACPSCRNPSPLVVFGGQCERAGCGTRARTKKQPRGRNEDHPRRQLIVAVLEEQNGCGFRELARLCGDMPFGSLSHHLRILVRQGKVWTKGYSPRVLHFVGSRPPTADGIREAIATNSLAPISQWVLDAIGSTPTTQKQVLASVSPRGVPASSIQYALYGLCERGMLSSHRSGRFVIYSPSSPA